MDEQNSTTSQAVTVENGSPYMAKSHESVLERVGMFAVPCFIGVLYLAVVIFFFVLFYRLVRASEKIAAKLEKGITVDKDNTNTII